MDRVLVSRQPIYGADMAVFGYELLFRDSEIDRASFSDGDQATADATPAEPSPEEEPVAPVRQAAAAEAPAEDANAG